MWMCVYARSFTQVSDIDNFTYFLFITDVKFSGLECGKLTIILIKHHTCI